ncbi:MAG: hypothetical protein ACLQUY_11215 [Ktedonobacterales bacterium]
MRKRTHILALDLTLAVLATAVVWFVQPHVALAADNEGEHLCLNDGNGQCLDLLNDVMSYNQPIIWNNQNLSHGLGWNLATVGHVSDTAPFTDTRWDNRYEGDAIVQVEKTTATGHDGCIGLYVALTVWQPCDRTNTRWVWSSTRFLVNINWTNSNDDPYLIGSSLDPAGFCAFDDNGTNGSVQSLQASCLAQFAPV